MKILLIVLLVVCLVGVAVIAAAQFNFDPLPRDAIADRILVEKSARRLTLFQKGRELKIYSVALGRAPEGPKEYEGDQRTPEGIYSIDFHKPDSDYHLALHVSYPEQRDIDRAAVEGSSAGSDIMIHGLPNGRGWLGRFHRRNDWTAGCIAVTDFEIEEIYRAVPARNADRIASLKHRVKQSRELSRGVFPRLKDFGVTQGRAADSGSPIR